MSSMIRYQHENEDLLLHSAPHGRRWRLPGAIFFSRDSGKSWFTGQEIEPDYLGYSVLCQLNNGKIACIYETEDCYQIMPDLFT
ncbi:MAG: sialidase family protein [Planctomycetaceae bacterium]